MTSKRFNNLKQFRKFLEKIPLDKYRETLKNIKWVEQDLHPILFPLALIFENYWEKQNFLNFESWFNKFWSKLNKELRSAKKLNDFKELLRAHRKFYEDKINNDLDKRFFLGFKARMYRTWMSVLTQLDFCYMFLYVSEKQNKSLNLECNAELDAKGVDARIGKIEFQVAKISERKVARGKERKITIPYAVYDIEDFKRKSESTRVSLDNRKKYKNALKAFYKYFILLKNGFVVFKENYVKQIIKNINNIEEVRKAVKNISLELSGEL